MVIHNDDDDGDEKYDDNGDDGVLTVHTVPTTQQGPLHALSHSFGISPSLARSSRERRLCLSSSSCHRVFPSDVIFQWKYRFAHFFKKRKGRVL